MYNRLSTHIINIFMFYVKRVRYKKLLVFNEIKKGLELGLTCT